MLKRLVIAVVVFVSILGARASATAAPITLFEDFSSGTLNPNFTLDLTSGFGVSFTGGQAVFSESNGFGNGYVWMVSNFAVVGDFVARVDVNRSTLGNAEAGLSVNGPSEYIDIFFIGGSLIYSNNFFSGGFPAGVGNSSEDVTFQLRRVGNTLFTEYRHWLRVHNAVVVHRC